MTVSKSLGEGFVSDEEIAFPRRGRRAPRAVGLRHTVQRARLALLAAFGARGADLRRPVARSAAPGRDRIRPVCTARVGQSRSEEHTSELQSIMRISYAVFCLKQKYT